MEQSPETMKRTRLSHWQLSALEKASDGENYLRWELVPFVRPQTSYSVIRSLVNRGYLDEDWNHGRAQWLYSITDAGRAALTAAA